MKTITAVIFMLVIFTDLSAQGLTNWKLFQKKDKMSGSVSKSCNVRSLNSIHLSFPYQGINYGRLKIEENGSVNVIVSIDKGQLNSGDDLSIEVKFDGGPDENFMCSVGGPGEKYLFITEAKRFIEKLVTAKKVMIRPDIYEDGGQILYFNVTGFNIKRFNMDLASNW